MNSQPDGHRLPIRWWRRDPASTPLHPLWQPTYELPPRCEIIEPRPVWVQIKHDLRSDPWGVYRRTSEGIEFEREVRGMLRAWMPSADGARLGLVSHELHTQNGDWRTVVTTWIPAHRIRRHRRLGRERDRW